MSGLQIMRSSGPIGVGQFSQVFKAVDDVKHLELAAKIFLPTCGDHAAQYRHCLREYSILKNVEHPNILKVVGMLGELADPSQAPCLLLHFAAKGDLFDRIQAVSSVGLHGDYAAKIIVGLCQGLDYLHSSVKLMHGDVKPENVLIDGDWTPLIADFDTCLRLGTTVEVMRGTVDYHPPEYRVKEESQTESHTESQTESQSANNNNNDNNNNNNNNNNTTNNNNNNTNNNATNNDSATTNNNNNNNNNNNADQPSTVTYVAAASADVWAMGMIMMAVITGTHCWYIHAPSKDKYWLWNKPNTANPTNSTNPNHPTTSASRMIHLNVNDFPTAIFDIVVTSILTITDPEARLTAYQVLQKLEAIPLVAEIDRFQATRLHTTKQGSLLSCCPTSTKKRDRRGGGDKQALISNDDDDGGGIDYVDDGNNNNNYNNNNRNNNSNNTNNNNNNNKNKAEPSMYDSIVDNCSIM